MLKLKKIVAAVSVGCWYWTAACAGEIVLSPAQKETARQSGASRLKEVARDQRTERDASAVLVIESGAEDEDVLFAPPRSSPEMGPLDNAAKARVYRQTESSSGSAPAVIVVPESVSPANLGTAQQAKTLLNKASEYRKGERTAGVGQTTESGVLPLVDCRATENASGRIGDDVSSGSVVIIVQGRKQIKARCR